MDESCKITWRSEAMQYYLMPCALQRHVRQTMRHVAISAAVDRHMSQLDDVYL